MAGMKNLVEKFAYNVQHWSFSHTIWVAGLAAGQPNMTWLYRSILLIWIQNTTTVFILNCFNPIPHFLLTSWTVCKKMKQTSFALHWSCDPPPPPPPPPHPRQDHWKLCNLVEVNGVYKHARYEKMWLKSYALCPALPFLSGRAMAGQLDWLHGPICYSYGLKAKYPAQSKLDDTRKHGFTNYTHTHTNCTLFD